MGVYGTEAYSKMGDGLKRKILPWLIPKELPDDVITQKVINLEIPTPDEVRVSLGDNEDTLNIFYLTLALLSEVSRREGKKPYFLHTYSVATKPDYRFNDPILPSKFRLTDFEKSLGQPHELKEEFGESIVGSYIVGDVLKYFFGDELANGVDYLTNHNELVMKNVNKSLKQLRKEELKRIGQKDISRLLTDELERLTINLEGVVEHYKRVEGALKEYVNEIGEYHEELDSENKEYIIGLMEDNFISPLSNKLRSNEIIDLQELVENVKNDFNHVLEIVNKEDYIEADPKLVHSFESKYLADLKKTLYQDYLGRIIKNVHEKLDKMLAEGQLLDDSLLSLPLVKTCDSIANVSTLEQDIVRTISQFRKARQVRRTDQELIAYLGKKDVDPSIYQRFERSVDYLSEVLVWKIKQYHGSVKDMAKLDTTYNNDAKLLDYMLRKEGQKSVKYTRFLLF